jgi:hypothetical protein
MPGVVEMQLAIPPVLGPEPPRRAARWEPQRGAAGRRGGLCPDFGHHVARAKLAPRR